MLTFPTYGCLSSTVRSLLLMPRQLAYSHPTKYGSTSHLLAFTACGKATCCFAGSPLSPMALLGGVLRVVVSPEGAQPMAVPVLKYMTLAGGGSLHGLCSLHFFIYCLLEIHTTFSHGSATRHEVSENSPLSASFTAAGDFPLRLCFNILSRV